MSELRVWASTMPDNQSRLHQSAARQLDQRYAQIKTPLPDKIAQAEGIYAADKNEESACI